MKKIKSAFLASCYPDGIADRFELCEEMDYLIVTELVESGRDLITKDFDDDSDRLENIEMLLNFYKDYADRSANVELLTALKQVIESDEQEFEIEG